MPTRITALLDWRPLAVAGLLVAALAALAQLPARSVIIVGREEGPQNDRPFIAGFFAADAGPFGPFRWSGAESEVRVPGLGAGPAVVSLRLLPIPQGVGAAEVVSLRAATGWEAPLPVRPVGTRFLLLLPPAPEGADHAFTLRSSTWRPPGDERDLGVPVGPVTLARAGPRPPPPTTVAWLLAALALWAGARLAGFGRRGAGVIMLAGAGLAVLAHLADAPRAALGAWPAAQALAAGAGLAGVLRVAAPGLLARLGAPAGAWALRWLLLLALLTFAARYGGKQVRGAMPGDINFHANRFAELAAGTIYLDAVNRGAAFPYPPGFYLTLAPLRLLGAEPRQALHAGAALADALSPLLVFAVAAAAWAGSAARAPHPSPRRGFARPNDPSSRGPRPPPPCTEERAGVLAAWVYAAAGAGLLAHWWNFSTHIFTAFAFLALLAAAAGLRGPRPAWGAVAGVAAMQGIVALGHFGYWINTGLAGGLLLALASILALRRRLTWGGVARLTIGLGAAHLAVLALFYSAYVPQLAQQAQTVAAGNDAGVLSDPALLAIYRHTIIEAGLRDHFALFLPPLALSGLALLAWGGRCGRGPTLALLGATLVVALGFAALPFFSGANLASRWLSFTACAVAAGAAPALLAMWRRGAAARLLALAVAGYAVWLAAALWLAPLAWRIRPPEPF